MAAVLTSSPVVTYVRPSRTWATARPSGPVGAPLDPAVAAPATRSANAESIPAAVSQRRYLPFFDQFRALMRQSRGHGLWIAVWSVVGWVGTGLAPALTHHTFLLMMLSPRALFVALAAHSVPLVPFVLLGTIRLGITDYSYFKIGRHFPHGQKTPRSRPSCGGWRYQVSRFTQRGDRLCRWLATRPGLAAAFLFFRPNGKYLALAGAYGVRGIVAAVASAGGTAIFLIAVHVGFGALL